MTTGSTTWLQRGLYYRNEFKRLRPFWDEPGPTAGRNLLFDSNLRHRGFERQKKTERLVSFQHRRKVEDHRDCHDATWWVRLLLSHEHLSLARTHSFSLTRTHAGTLSLSEPSHQCSPAPTPASQSLSLHKQRQQRMFWKKVGWSTSTSDQDHVFETKRQRLGGRSSSSRDQHEAAASTATSWGWESSFRRFTVKAESLSWKIRFCPPEPRPLTQREISSLFLNYVGALSTLCNNRYETIGYGWRFCGGSSLEQPSGGGSNWRPKDWLVG